MAYPALFQLLKTHRPIPPMSLDDLRQVIEKPAALPDVCLNFDENLVGDLLFEVREQTGALPLLQFTLDQLFARRENRTLTLAAYRLMGGLRGALARHAEATYASLRTDEHRSLARTLFLRLIEPGSTEQDTTRRRADMTELILSDTQQTQTLREVADEFVKARLLTTSDIAGKPTIEVSHEALIREWERLAHWLRDAREDIIIQKHISQAASAWIAKGRRPDDDGLYRGTVLADALEWSRRNIASEEEAAFLHTSAKAEKWRKVEETADTQRMQRTGKVAAMLVPAVILAIVVAIAALWKTSNAQSQMHIARTAQARAEAALATPHGLQVTPFNKKPVALASALQPITLYWQPVIQSFDEVEMVLVPPGCFMMGSEDEEETDFIKRKYSNEQPVHEVCFNNPFWIDRYEVTNEQFEQHEGVASTWSSWSNPSQPRTDIMWFEARDFCASRGGQLPTEAQWEYAARGPESWKYPWGNQFIEDSVVYGGNSGEMPAEVGGRGLGASWVGAIDLSGNVAEWTNTIYNQDQFPYPYSAVDGRELSSDEPDVSYVVRGGSYNLGDFDIRAAIRLHQLAYFSAEVTGFRCARSQ